MAEFERTVETFESWLKLTFRLLVGDFWEQISEQIVDGDKTYRWCREIIRNSLSNLEHSVDGFLSGAIINIKNEIWQLRYPEFAESECPAVGFSNTFTMAYDLTRNLHATRDKLCALKVAMIAGCFGGERSKILSIRTKIFQVLFRLKDDNNGEEVSQEINEAFYIFVDFLTEFGIDTNEESLKMGERILHGREREWNVPGSWCFGDFGNKDGQMEYPADVMVNKGGDFLVLEQDSWGKNTIQRLQLFDKKGRYQKTLLQRGRDDISSMNNMALDNKGNVVVTLKDKQNIGRVNAYSMEGDLVLAVKVLASDAKFPSFFTSVTVDKEGRILVVEFHEMAVRVYSENGDFILKFGQSGRSAQCGVFENISCISVSPNNEIYVCDPLRSVQVFNNEGEFLRFFKSSGDIPTHVIVGEDEVYALNRNAHELLAYSLDGENVLRKAGGLGGELGRLWSPLAIARTPDGSIAVAEKESHRIQVLKL